MSTQSTRSLRRRLLPLHVGIGLQGTMLWVPVEKLFMNEIGFDSASVGIMAAAYAAVVPIFELPSGILADRWSRRGVLIVSSIALMLCALICGLSNSVPAYIVGTLVLGVYFAMYSGTLEAVVYDTVLEETGDSESFERRLGRVQLVESSTLVASALAGGWIAGVADSRLTYFLTVPFAALSIIAFLRFAEPRLHKTGERTPLRRHLAVTYRTLTRRGRLLHIITLAVLIALIMQVIFEFGPLWLVALAVPAVLYGPHWAGLMSTLGFGGLLAGRLRLTRPATLGAVVGLMVLASLVLTTSAGFVLVTAAQIMLSLLIVITSIHVTRLLHDSVPSTIRTGVASGVSTISWLVFVPFALVFGLVSKHHGVQTAGWMIFAVTVLAGLLLAKVAFREVSHDAARVRPPEPHTEDRMPLGHLGVNVSDLSSAKAFYDVLMPMLEFEPFVRTDTEFSYRPANGKLGAWIFFYDALEEGEYSRNRPGLQHLAFMVNTREAVHRVLEAATTLGAPLLHEPQEFPQYHDGYYATFFQDPDGFTVEVVCHRDRSAALNA